MPVCFAAGRAEERKRKEAEAEKVRKEQEAEKLRKQEEKQREKEERAARDKVDREKRQADEVERKRRVRHGPFRCTSLTLPRSPPIPLLEVSLRGGSSLSGRAMAVGGEVGEGYALWVILPLLSVPLSSLFPCRRLGGCDLLTTAAA